MSSAASAKWVHLTGDERVLWADTPTLLPAVPVITAGFVLALVGVWLSRIGGFPGPTWLALGLLPVGLGAAAWAYLARWATRYVFTTKAVYEKTGLFSRTVTQVRFDRVQNTAFDQSFVERALSYGDLAVYTAGSGGVDLSLRDVPDLERVNDLVTTRLSEVAAASRPEGSASPPHETDERPAA